MILKIARLLIFACAVTCLDSYAWASENGCDKHLLTRDQRYEAVSHLPQQDAKRRAVVTDLLNEVMSPAVVTLAEAIRQAPAADIAAFEILESEIDPMYDNVSGASVDFTERYDFRLSRINGFHLKGTSANRIELHKIFQVIKWASANLVWQLDSNDLGWLKDSTKVVDIETFNGLDIRSHLDEGLQSIGEILSLLSADKIPGLTTAEIIKMVSRPNETRPSLVVQSALVLAPGVLAPFTRYNRRPERPLLYQKGSLTWSPSMRASFAKQMPKKQNLEMAQQGLGCPVARCLGGEKVSSLQALLTAIVEKAGL